MGLSKLNLFKLFSELLDSLLDEIDLELISPSFVDSAKKDLLLVEPFLSSVSGFEVGITFCKDSRWTLLINVCRAVWVGLSSRVKILFSNSPLFSFSLSFDRSKVSGRAVLCSCFLSKSISLVNSWTWSLYLLSWVISSFAAYRNSFCFSTFHSFWI